MRSGPRTGRTWSRLRARRGRATRSGGTWAAWDGLKDSTSPPRRRLQGAMKAPLTLETERLLLRQLEPRDHDAHTAMMADAEVVKFLGDGKPMDRVQSWRTMAAILGHWTL